MTRAADETVRGGGVCSLARPPATRTRPSPGPALATVSCRSRSCSLVPASRAPWPAPRPSWGGRATTSRNRRRRRRNDDAGAGGRAQRALPRCSTARAPADAWPRCGVVRWPGRGRGRHHVRAAGGTWGDLALATGAAGRGHGGKAAAWPHRSDADHAWGRRSCARQPTRRLSRSSTRTTPASAQ
ncbi:hypothetical protein QJS66_10070 [Kocuria rhizophila]|nr:hypothetical protein QJS66_10070 [Kocuria rhizophila]